MSYFLISNCFASTLPARDRITLMALASFAGHDGTGVRPSIDLVSAMTGIKRRATISAIAALRAADILEEVKPAGLHTPIEYKIHADRIPRPEAPREYQLHLMDQTSDELARRRNEDDPYSTVYRRI